MTTAELAALAPGIHAGIPFTEYQDIDAVNNSTLKLFGNGKTPAHARWKMTRPDKDRKPLRIGDACHAAILEPERFDSEYARSPKIDRRTNKGKAAAAAWAEAHPDQIPLLPDEWALVTAMREAAWAHPTARTLLDGKGKNEQTVIWEDAETGLLCKARMDRFTTYQDWTTVVDVKTSKNVAERAFLADVVKYKYHQAAAFYLDGLNVLAEHPRRFIHLVVEKEPPYCVIVYELDNSALAEGRAQYRRAIALYAECKESGEWPGYKPGVYGVDIPAWGYELTAPPK